MNQTLNMTRQRKMVYDALKSATDHPTAADIMERLRQDGHKVAYATVYNALRYLTDAHVIREVPVGFGPVRYDARIEEHQHAVCQRCGRVAEVSGLDFSTYRKAVQEATGYEIIHFDVIAKGVCPECASRDPVSAD